MGNYESYKSLRNLLRKYNLQASLEDLWKYTQMLQKNIPMEHIWVQSQPVPISHYVYAWDIPVICRELVLNATNEGTKRLRTWNEFSAVLKAVRETEDAMAKCQSSDDVLLHLQPTIQQQFPWQQKHYLNELMRAFKIFSVPTVDALLIRETGIPAKVWFFVGFAIAGAMNRSPGINADQSYEFVGIPRAQSDLVYQRISTTYETLKGITQKEQQYDARWKFTLNPMLRWPLLSLQPKQPHLLHCPIPIYVLQRVSSGLYYEIVKTPGFDKPFGDAFEAYAGEILRLSFPQPRFTVQAEQEYLVGKQMKLTTDWLLSDDQAIALIECKSKRMTPVGKISSDPEILKKEVEALAKAIVQVYKNIGDALKGFTPWQPSERAIYPLILTLEDWYLLGPVEDFLHQEVVTQMTKANLDLAWITDMPYSVVSSADFEATSPTIAHVGLSKFFATRFSDGKRNLPIRTFAHELCPDVYKQTARRVLFADEWRNIFPHEALPESL